MQFPEKLYVLSVTLWVGLYMKSYFLANVGDSCNFQKRIAMISYKTSTGILRFSAQYGVTAMLYVFSKNNLYHKTNVGNPCISKWKCHS